jgi:hypothetical protein
MKISKRGIISFDACEMNRLSQLMPVDSNGVMMSPLARQGNECDWNYFTRLLLLNPCD